MSRFSEPPSDFTVLVLTSGDGTGVNFTRCLRRAGGYRTVGLDTSLDDHLVSEANERVLLPALGEAELIEAINELSARYGVDLVYAADTNDVLDAVSRNRGRLIAPVFLPDLADHLRAEDKWQTYERLRDAGLPVPRTRLVVTEDDLERCLAEHGSIWLRRISGSGGAGSLATDSLPLARAWVDVAAGWGIFTAAERLSARTATFSGVWHDGHLIASQLRERTAWKYAHLSPSGVTGITSGQKTIWDEPLHELAVACVRAVMDRPHGAIGVDFTYGLNGQPYPTEVQPARFYSSIDFLAAVGINLPDVYCRLHRGAPIPMDDSLINPVRTTMYWFKAVDKLPVLLSSDEINVILKGASAV